MKKCGAEIFVESLQKEGVDAIFGHPGGVVLKIYDVLMDAPIRHMLMRHEQGAVHAADGYARATGRPGVCLATSGPGATNCVTGLVTANMDSIPIVVFTGQVPTTAIGNDAFQEADIFGITMPCVKHSYVVRRVEDLARVIKEAFYIAQTGKPGPVLVDIPKDVSQLETEFKYPHEVQGTRICADLSGPSRPNTACRKALPMPNSRCSTSAAARSAQMPHRNCSNSRN